MTNLSKVLLPQPEQRGSIELGVAADVIIGVRMEFLAITVAPDFSCLIPAFGIDRLGIPVVLLTLDVVAALQQQNALSGWRQFVGQRAAARARADDDHVVVVFACHGFLVPRSQNSKALVARRDSH